MKLTKAVAKNAWGKAQAERKITVKGNNIDVDRDGNTLTLTIDLKKDVGDSSTGKSKNIACSFGNVNIGDGMVLGLNLYRPKQ